MDMSSHGEHGSSHSTSGATFFSSTKTPLYSIEWQPTTIGAYAGSCVFLIFLAAALRVLLATKSLVERRWLDEALARRYIKVEGLSNESEKIDANDESEHAMLLSARGVEERVKVIRNKARPVLPWRATVDLPRAALTTVIAGVAYLLMLAVMTMNVGYFLSVLGGIFAAELAVGRFIYSGEH